MRPLTPLDNGFLSIETRRTPMHVGSLLLFSPTRELGDRQVEQLFARVARPTEFRSPFNQKLAHPLGRAGMPHWVEDKYFDIEYHVRHSALPKPGRFRELFALVSRLHGTLLDRTRPLWEWYLIEGLESGQFALYAKLHHALIDGMAGMRLLNASLSEDPSELEIPFMWEKAADERRKKQKLERKSQQELVEAPARPIATAADLIRAQLGVVPGLGRALQRTATTLLRPADERMAIPFQAPRCSLNARIGGARRFVAQSYEIERIDRVRAVYGATVNDIILAMSASALRRYMIEYGGGLPSRPLTAMTPVSVRPRDADDWGNAVSAAFVNLGTHIEDPEQRLQVILASASSAKAMIRDLSFTEVMLYTLLLTSPFVIPAIIGMGAYMPPMSVIISNVPGPKNTLYWNGAKMDGMYPVSIPYHGLALNITVTSYAGSLDFGIVACRQTLPRVQRLIDFIEDGLVELERIAGVA